MAGRSASSARSPDRPNATGSPAASDLGPDARPRSAWLALGLLFAVGIILRVILLPTQGVRGDLDQFVGWVHHIAVNGLGTLYDGTEAGPVTFGPVMAYVWAALAALEPGFRTATDASDVVIRSLMKAPASLADLGLAAIAVVALWERPRWAILAAAAILLHPAVIDVSAWWGQYESIFTLTALAAVVAAAKGHNGLAAALVAMSLMTKPQALPLVVPFAAWFWASGSDRTGLGGDWRGGFRELTRAGLIGLGVTAVLWLPFLAAGGPADYLANLAHYQSEVFNVLSVRAWNLWWLVQMLAAGGEFIADDVAFLGPVTLRHVGYAMTAIVSIYVANAILRDPRPRTLVLGVAASVLAFFTFMTQMHERYAYAALVVLVLLIADVGVRWLWVALGVVVTLNLLAAVPPAPVVEAWLPVDGFVGVAGSVALVALTLYAIRLVRRPDPALRVTSAGGEQQ